MDSVDTDVPKELYKGPWTIDRLIEILQKARTIHGGDAKVMIDLDHYWSGLVIRS